jgi:ABC-type glycerol-3-phosphate transport system substrate-binding protein
LRIKKTLFVKVLFSLLLLILIPILLNGCTNYQSDQIPEQLQGNLLVWHSLEGKGELTKIVANGFDEFEQLNPQVNVISEVLSQKKFLARFVQQSQSGLGPSAIIIFAKYIPQLVKAGYLQPIDPNNIDLSIYFPPTLNQIRYQDQIYGVPLRSQLHALCYNEKKLQNTEDPLLSQPPTTLEGLIKRAQKGYSVGMVSSFEDTLWGMGIFGASLWNDQGEIQPQFKGWGEWIEWLKYASIQPNFILNREQSLLHNAFAQGDLTYYVCNSSEIVDLKNSLKDNLKVALLPQSPENKASPLLYTKVMVFNRSNSDNENHLGLVLAKFLTNPEQQIQGIVETQSFIPTNRHVTLEGNLLPIESVLLKQSQTAIAIPLDNVEQLLTIFENGESIYQQAIAGEITSEDAVKQLMLLIKSDSVRELK